MAHNRKGRARTPAIMRMAEHISPEPNSGCWLWSANVTGNGYGRTSRGGLGTAAMAHRLMYELTVGPIPDDSELDHLCRVRCCVNPAHLEVVTRQENAKRRQFAQTRCKHGHELTPENTYVDARGWRACRICRRRAVRTHEAGMSGPANSIKSHCVRGHEYDTANTLVDKLGRRICRACRRDRERQQR